MIKHFSSYKHQKDDLAQKKQLYVGIN